MTNDIYTYISDNFNIKVTDYTFKRDYIKEPLRKIPKEVGGLMWEKAFKEDLEYLYITLNMRLIDISNLLSINRDIVLKNLKQYNISKPTDLRYKNIEKTCSKLYNSTNVFSSSSSIRDTINQTIKTKYNVENIFQLDDIKEKSKKTRMKKYGFEYATQSSEIKNKTKETCLKKYGTYCYTKSSSFKNRYKDKDYVKTINKKIYITKTKTGSLGESISKEELKIFEIIKTRYPNVISQYYSVPYPYKCDFYIPEIDTYIEYNGFWMHGKEPYIGTKEQQDKVKLWESKNTKQYKRAIETWTKIDVLKRETAKNNSLNYLEFFNLNEFTKWFE